MEKLQPVEVYTFSDRQTVRVGRHFFQSIYQRLDDSLLTIPQNPHPTFTQQVHAFIVPQWKNTAQRKSHWIGTTSKSPLIPGPSLSVVLMRPCIHVKGRNAVDFSKDKHRAVTNCCQITNGPLSERSHAIVCLLHHLSHGGGFSFSFITHWVVL